MRLDELENEQKVEIKTYTGEGWAWVPATVVDPIGNPPVVDLPDGTQMAIPAHRIRPRKGE